MEVWPTGMSVSAGKVTSYSNCSDQVNGISVTTEEI